MKKMWFMRHQVEGVLFQYGFVSPPTPGQIAPLHTLMAARHGTSHPKTKETYFFQPIEVDVYEPGEVPEVKLPGMSRDNVAGFGPVEVRGEVTVINPEDVGVLKL